MKGYIGIMLVASLGITSCNSPSVKIATEKDSLAQAAMAMDKALLTDSNNQDLWVRRAKLAEQIKDTTGAIGFYIEANRVYPTPEAMLSLANLMAERKDARVLNITANTTKLFPSKSIEPHVHFIRGVYYSRIGNTAIAMAALDSCIRADYRYYEAYMEKGFILYDNKNYQQAATIFATIISLNPQYADAYYWVAKCNEAMGKKEEAILHYEQALRFDTSIKEAAIALQKLK
ncbi:MAG: tetratricopeptide repeat protein [Chitinophagaceae bacterium]|nr:tetratricopeptide repeat protein [Chitinophagaceae bacterium]